MEHNRFNTSNVDQTIKENFFPEKPFFSVIIPTYNRASLIEKTIRSVLNQTFKNFEVHIIDDGSTDETESIVSKIIDKRLLYHKTENRERGAARNFGTRIAKGDYITFLDSDDIFYPQHLEEVLKVIKANNSPEIIHIRYEITDENTNKTMQQPLLNDDINKKLITGNFMSCQGVFLRKGIALANLFNEDRNLSALEDWELWLRISAKYKIYYSNLITSAIIDHDTRSVVNTNAEQLINRVNTLLKYVLENSELTSYYKKSIHKFQSSCFSYIALHIALTKKNRLTTLKYMFKSIKENPQSVFKKRFFAIIKHII